MNLLKKATNAIIFAVIISSTFQCASPKEVAAVPQTISDLNLKNPVVFQEWFAGINVGGTGINLFIPKSEVNEGILIDSVYFRNMKGKLIKNDAMYSVILKNDSPHYVPNPSNTITNPFNLTPDECIVSYTENGQTKYLKIASIVEKAGTYYENGPPSVYQGTWSTMMATVGDN